LLFEGFYLAADGGLGDEQFCRGFGETQMPRRRLEAANQVQRGYFPDQYAIPSMHANRSQISFDALVTLEENLLHAVDSPGQSHVN
jgi:hypothetical protein